MKQERTKEAQRLTPRETLHAHCHYCVQSRMDEDVRDCTGYIVYATGKPCPFYQHRLSAGRVSVKVLRRLCLDECMGGSHELVTGCEDPECILYPYRLGKSPALMGKDRSNGKGVATMKARRIMAAQESFERQISTNAP